MYSEREKRRWPLVLLICACALALLILMQPQRVRQDMSDESVTAVRTAVMRAARQCYAVEGAYPPDLKYLQENYGLQVNTNDFYITYDAFAENLPPDVRVKYKHEQ